MIYIIGGCCILTTIVLLIPLKKLDVVSKIMIALTLSLIIAFGGTKAIQRGMEKLIAEPITITATRYRNNLSEGSEIWIKRVIVDNKTYEANKVFKGTWIEKDGNIGWKEYDTPDGLENFIIGKIPVGTERGIVFESNKYRGVVKLNFNNNEEIKDLYSNDSKNNGEVEIKLPDSSITTLQQIDKYNRFIFILLFFVGFIFVISLFHYDSKKENFNVENVNIEGREIWIDMLKIVSAFAIVLIHISGSIYSSFTDNIHHWYRTLYLNSITRFAVPCFFMVSGMLIISKKDTIKKIIIKRLPRIILPLIFWSICYIVFDKIFWNKDYSVLKEIVTIPFEHKQGHLWYIYQLIGLYLLAPIINIIYDNTSKKMKMYFITLILIIPGFFDMLIRMCGYSNLGLLTVNWTHIGLPEIAICILAKFLLDEFENKPIKMVWIYISAVIGFSGIVVSSYCISIKANQPTFEMFEQTKLPVVLFGASVYMIFYSYRDKLNGIPSKIKVLIKKLSELTLGVYFIHMIIVNCIQNRILININPNGNMLIVVGEAVLYYCISMLCCYIISKVPYLRKIVV